MGITLRNITGSALTYDQMDENFRFLSQSYFYLSGSNVATGNFTLTGSLRVSAGVTGSLLGTASFATSASQALTASFATRAATASFVTPLIQDVTITGSLFVSNSIDSSARSLYNSAGVQVIDWENYKIDDSSGVLSVDWANRKLVNTSGDLTVDWEGNILTDPGASPSVDWKNRLLNDVAGNTVINYYDQNNLQVTGDTAFTGDTTFTGSVTVSGSSTFTNIGPANFNGVTNMTGSVNISGSKILIGSLSSNGTFTQTGSFIVSGAATFSDTVFTVTGSQFYSGSSTYIGNQTITGSLRLTSNGTGTGLFINGQKQFNYISLFHTASITPTQNISGSFVYSTVVTSSGISVVSGSRITFANTGVYNIQFSAQMFTSTGANVYIWLKKNGTNVANSAGRIGPTSNNEYLITAWNYVDTFTSGSYIEIAYQSDQTNTEFQYIAAAGNIPAAPSIIATVTQVA